MSQQHSELYKNHGLITEHAVGNHKEQWIDASVISEQLKNAPLPDLAADGSSIYDKMSDLLRETNDAQFGIVSKLNEHDEWVRDATNAIPLADRMSHNSPVIEANNALLRCLSRLRPIDYAIGKKDTDTTPRTQLQSHFADYTNRILNIAQNNNLDNDTKLKQIEVLEKGFNTLLVKALHQANLTQGCNNAEAAENLLFHYRNLSSLLEPARTMITLTYDETAQVFQRETQYPVIDRTATQRLAIEQLRKIQPYPFAKEKNAHNSKNIATQEADALFVDLMLSYDRALSAQARKTHLVGAKNAFIVKNELIHLGDTGLPDDLTTLYTATEENTLWLARSGVPVYVGKGETKENVQLHTQENLNQIRNSAIDCMGALDLNIHVTCLNTVSPLENQDTMVKHLYKATRKNSNNNDNISYAPTNPDGTFRMIDLAPGLFADDDKPELSAPLQKKDRLDSVAAIMLQAASQPGTISLVQCASGQDRTGTAVEKATQIWMNKRYAQLNLDPSNIGTMRAQGGNAAEITTHHIHGSPGMKTDSKANNAFGDETAFSKQESEQFYLKSAKTNKKNAINKDKLDFLANPGEQAITEYMTNLKTFETSLEAYKLTIDEDANKQKYFDKGINVLESIKKIAGNDPRALDSQSLTDLNSVLPHCTALLNNPDIRSPEAKENLRRLASLSDNISGKTPPLWKALGVGLLTFACIALVVGGVLAAIPSGGASLLLTVAGVGGGLLVATAAGTAAGFFYGRETGLAKSITDFKSALAHTREDEKQDPEPSEPSFKI